MIGGLEAEVPAIMVIGFGIVTGIVIRALTTIYRGRGSKDGLAWFIAQWVLTVGAFFIPVKVIERTYRPGDYGI